MSNLTEIDNNTGDDMGEIYPPDYQERLDKVDSVPYEFPAEEPPF